MVARLKVRGDVLVVRVRVCGEVYDDGGSEGLSDALVK